MQKAVEYLPSTTKESTKSAKARVLYIYSEQPHLLIIHSIRGYLYQQLNKVPEALQSYQQALEMGDPIIHRSEMAAVHNGIGLLLFLEGDYKDSCKHHEKAITLIDDSHPLLWQYKKNLSLARNRYDYLEQTQKM